MSGAEGGKGDGTPGTKSSASKAEVSVPKEVMIDRLTGSPTMFPPDEYRERVRFYSALCDYWAMKNMPINTVPSVSKQTVDLCRLYDIVQRKGGFKNVSFYSKLVFIGGHRNHFLIYL